MKKLKKYLQLWNEEKWNDRDVMWFYTLLLTITILGFGIVSLSYHIDELKTKNDNLWKVISVQERYCE